MIPTTPADHTQPAGTDVQPRFFLDDAYDAGTDADWWLDLGRVDIPAPPAM